MSTMSSSRLLAATLLLLLLVAGFGGNGQASVYEGKTVEIVVPFNPGGGSDAWARVIAPYLGQYLGASTQVVNIPGGSGIAGANEYVLRYPSDGMALLVSGGSTVFNYMFNVPAVRYEFRDMKAIYASPLGGVVYASADLGVTSPADLRTTNQPLIYGGISATGLDAMPLLVWHLLELDVTSILGYEGRGPIRVALEQGETTIDYQLMSAYQSSVAPMVEEGTAVPLFTFGMLDPDGNVIRDPMEPDLPSVYEVYKDFFGREPSGPAWEAYKAVLAAGVSSAKVLWVHGDVPADAYAELVAAATAMELDPEFAVAADAIIGEYDSYVGEAADRIFGAVTGLPSEVHDWLLNWLKEEHDVDVL